LTVGANAHAEGYSSSAYGIAAHAEGASTSAQGDYSHAEGMGTKAVGVYTSAHGLYTNALGTAQAVFGKFNTAALGATSMSDTSGSIFVVGVGTSLTATKNALRVTNAGECCSNMAFNSAGADYAEMFEWYDGNIAAEDRRGLFVTLDGEKIRLANGNDEILGIISAHPSVVGDNAADEWFNKYKRDIFGAEIFEIVEVEEEEIKDDKGNVVEIIPAHTEKRRILNPDYNENQEYISRSERKEWATVGMLGKLVVIDDGTCEVNGYCAPGQNGIATKSEEKTKYRVMTRLDENHVKVLAMCM
jgi:hypothetical protein